MFPFPSRRFLLVTATVLALLPAALAARTVVYVSNGGSASVSLFDFDTVTGDLSPRGEVALAGNPGPLVISPDGKFVYAALRASSSVQALAVNRTDGSLTAGANVPIGTNAAYLHIDKTGRNLLAADYSGNQVSVHRIAEDGSLSGEAATRLATGKNPHSIQTDATDRFALAPLCGADRVLQFRFDPASGRLEPNEPAEVSFQPGDGPRHFAFHPREPWVYVINEKSSSVTALRYDAAHGTLAPLQTLPTIPAGAAKNSCADIHITPDGKYLYGSNRGHDSLAAFAIDQKTGTLTAIGHTLTEKTPRAFEIDPSGKFVLVAGQGSNRLAAYRLDAASGALHPLKTYDAGKAPTWVLIVPLDGRP